MDMLLGGPGRYVQGPGLLKRLGQYTAPLGQGLFVVTDPAGRQRMERDVREGMAGAGPLVWAETGAACCEQEARRLAGPEGNVVCAGSLYLIGEMRTVLREERDKR